MGSIKLKEDLNNCLINFDRRVLISELSDDYKRPYVEVNQVVEDYLNEQKRKDDAKYVKRYLIHGEEAKQEGEIKKEVYKIVAETKLKDWLDKLRNAKSALYSVEVAGGAKSGAPVFKPMSVKECEKSHRTTKTVTVEMVDPSTSSETKKQEVKQEKKFVSVKKESAKEPLKSASTVDPTVKKTSPKAEISAKDKKADVKKGIVNFFGPSTAAAATTKKSEVLKESKTENGTLKPTAAKKMQDFFKKQAELPKAKTENIKATGNTSIQLFEDEEPEEEEAVSSDEEEKLEALKRDIIASDVEMVEEKESQQGTLIKRRRILDSDDEEEDPPVKQEKMDIEEETAAQEIAAETYLDEDGFVITKKAKQNAVTKTMQPTLKTPPVTIKTPTKETKKSSSSLKKDTKAATNQTAKTKQAGIMNFFSKK